jgi:hypothetical protein
VLDKGSLHQLGEVLFYDATLIGDFPVSLIKKPNDLINLESNFKDLAGEELLDSLQAGRLIGLEIRKHGAKQTEGLFGRNWDVIQSVYDYPNLFINPVDCLFAKELLADHPVEHFTDAQYHLVDLSVTQELDEGLLEMFEDHLVIGRVSGQHLQETQEGVLDLPGEFYFKTTAEYTGRLLVKNLLDELENLDLLFFG